MGKNSMNRVMLIGNLGKDPELLFSDGPSPCMKLALATTDHWKDKNEQKQERTEWHNVEYWGQNAKVLSAMIGKGMSVFIDGSIRYRTVDEPGGKKRYFTDIRAREVLVLDWKTGARNRESTAAFTAPPPSASAPEVHAAL